MWQEMNGLGFFLIYTIDSVWSDELNAYVNQLTPRIVNLKALHAIAPHLYATTNREPAYDVSFLGGGEGTVVYRVNDEWMQKICGAIGMSSEELEQFFK